MGISRGYSPNARARSLVLPRPLPRRRRSPTAVQTCGPSMRHHGRRSADRTSSGARHYLVARGRGWYDGQVPAGRFGSATYDNQSGLGCDRHSNFDLSTIQRRDLRQAEPGGERQRARRRPLRRLRARNDAFAKLDEATLATLKNDPTVLLPTLFYHMVLGYLGRRTVAGKMPPRTADRSRSPVGRRRQRSMTPRRWCAPTAPRVPTSTSTPC